MACRISQGGHHVGHWPTFLVVFVIGPCLKNGVMFFVPVFHFSASLSVCLLLSLFHSWLEIHLLSSNTSSTRSIFMLWFVLLSSSFFFMVALWNRADHYIFMLWFLSSMFFFSSPNLSGRRLDVCHTSTHSVALVQIQNACLKCAARGSLKIQDAKNRHFGTIAQLCQAVSSPQRHVSTIGKKLLNNDTSSTCRHNMVNFGLLTAEICWRVLGTPANFNGFCVLAALLHGTLVVLVSQTLRR